MKYRNRLWILLGDLTEDAQVRCIEYDSQLMFTRKMFLDYYTVENTLYQEFITTIYDSNW